MSAMWVVAMALGAAVSLAQGAPPESRVALVIGNANYPTAPLRNPVNDARAIADRLRALGFEVDLKTNVTQREMTRAVSLFGQSLKPGSVGLFYYAGHGMQVRGRNFLIPVDAEIQTEASVRSEAVDLDLVLEQLGPARLSVVILDACRNNPFEGRFRTTRGSGLAQVDAPKGTLLAYATAPGKVASDGDGVHGLYTSELLKAMELSGIKVEEVFKIVRVNVIKATASEQIPWESSSLTGDYYFRPVDRTAEAAKSAKETKAKQAELQAKLDAERLQREQDAALLKAEMEALRREVRRLMESSAAANAQAPVAAKPETVPPGTEPKRVAAAKAEPSVPVEAKAAAAGKAAPAPSKDAKGQVPAAPPAAPTPRPAPDKVAAAPATAGAPPDSVRRDWARRVALLEGQRGAMTFSKAVAVLFEPLSDKQLLVLVEKERHLKGLPYHSALATGVASTGAFTFWRVRGERSVTIAVDEAKARCTRNSEVPCSVVMVDGEFREADFLDWARSVQGRNIPRMRHGYLALLPGN